MGRYCVYTIMYLGFIVSKLLESERPCVRYVRLILLLNDWHLTKAQTMIMFCLQLLNQRFRGHSKHYFVHIKIEEF